MKYEYPINILCFNRPEYLEKLMKSIYNQTIQISQEQIFFWVDGYPDSKDEFLGREDKTEIVKELIEKYFPQSQMNLSERNLGIAKNYWRAEVNSFETIGAKQAFFLEEDLVLSEFYFENLIRMNDFFEADSEVSHISPSGDVPLNLTNPSGEFQAFGHNWGYSLKAWHHFERRDLLSQYLEIISRHPYHKRNLVEFELLHHFYMKGILLAGTSQDAVKDALRNYFARISITTSEVWATNIGVIGEHFQFETPHNNRPLSNKIAAFPKSFDVSTKPILFRDGYNKTVRLIFQNYIVPSLNASVERDALVGERDALVGERDTLVGERDALVGERDALVGERDALVGERDALVNSTIWKSTKIVRLIVSLLRQLFSFK